MKVLFALIALTLTTSQAAFALSPISYAPYGSLRFFFNYDPAKRTYDSTVVSTPENPLSAELFLQEKTAVCFKDSNFQIEELIEGMIEVFNKDEGNKGTALSLQSYDVVMDEATGRVIVKFAILKKSDREMVTYHFDRVRMCIR